MASARTTSCRAMAPANREHATSPFLVTLSIRALAMSALVSLDSRMSAACPSLKTFSASISSIRFWRVSSLDSLANASLPFLISCAPKFCMAYCVKLGALVVNRFTQSVLAVPQIILPQTKLSLRSPEEKPSQRAEGQLPTPVDPYPASPLSVESRLSTSRTGGDSYLSSTSWAILSPLSTRKGSHPKLNSMTPRLPL
ncbi:hypothetical protein 43R [Ranavirus ambystoma1]|uniref:Uncharacterized protein n=2 Tax=Ranavirus ambystoma1 TaxID=265294 RepID=A0A0U2QDH3_9VIRU|nr:hypothetical protein 43R [Ambystoma tigrinum virus]